MPTEEAGPAPHRPSATARLTDYLALARLDHSSKHVFVLPGIAFAWLLRGPQTDTVLRSAALGAAALLCAASANYVLNEWLDRASDRHHPTKSLRPAVQREMDGRIVAALWLVLVATALSCALAAGATMAAAAACFVLQGLVYNVPPLRTKDRVYLDVLSESVNNPLRLMIGWAMIDPLTLPPSSIFGAYWAGGAFLMAAKRLAEYRQISGVQGVGTLVAYRASFRGYTETSLITSCFVYALLSLFLLAVFLIKYRIEYVLTVPGVIALFAYYLALAMRPDSAAQLPEKLYRERILIALVLFNALAFAVTTVVEVPVLEELTGQRFITMGP